MTLYCGIDLHCNNSVVAVLDERDRTVYERRLEDYQSQVPESKLALVGLGARFRCFAAIFARR